jgi:hypothetical protein
MPTRDDVNAAINSERNYQVARWGESAHVRSLDEWIMYIEDYAQEARHQTVRGNESAALDTVRKIATLCVNCMEQHGAPLRK